MTFHFHGSSILEHLISLLQKSKQKNALLTIPESDSTKKEGDNHIVCEFFFTSNRPGHERNERSACRSVFIPAVPMPKEDDNATIRTQEWNSFIYGDRSPKQYTYSLAPYVLSDVFKQRLVTNSNLMRSQLNCAPRTADNYALPMTFMDFLLEQFRVEMAAKGLTREAWLEWLKTKWVPYLKKIHITEQERRSLIDRYTYQNPHE